MNIHVVALKGLYERFGHAVRLWTSNRREAWNEPQSDGEVDRLVRTIAAAVIREPLDGMRQRMFAEAPFDALHHQIADHFSADPSGACAPGDDLSIAGVEGKSGSHHLADRVASSEVLPNDFVASPEM